MDERPSRHDTLTDERLDSLERWKEGFEERFNSAFPQADEAGHCRYHLLMIETIEEKKKLRKAIVEKTLGGLVWSLIIFLGIAVAAYVKDWFHH